MNRKCYFLLFLFLINSYYNCKVKSIAEAEIQIERRFSDAASDKKQIKNASLLVHSDKLSLHISRAYGNVYDGKKEIPAVPTQPFHIASIGKMFTSVLILQEVEKDNLKLDAKISKILGKDILKELYVTDGVDYSDQVTIEQLLNHTSGIADYFESTDPKNKNEKAVIGEITKHPNQFWTPVELVDFTRKYQKAVGKPGEKFFYSDTGYILLGLILEKITSKKFESLLSERIFNPLFMNSTYMHLRSSPMIKNHLALSHMFLSDIDVTNFRSVSADWAGGGVVSTTEDLLLFQKAFVTGKLLSPNMTEKMKGKSKFLDGIYYGLGLMTVRFGDMLFLMAGTPELHGHSGILSTLAFYSPEYDTHIIANFGSAENIDASFEMMFHIMRILKDAIEIEK